MGGTVTEPQLESVSYCRGNDPLIGLLDLFSCTEQGSSLPSQVLAGSDPFGRDVEHVRHRLGKDCMEQRFFSMDPGSVCICASFAAVQANIHLASKAERAPEVSI